MVTKLAGFNEMAFLVHHPAEHLLLLDSSGQASSCLTKSFPSALVCSDTKRHGQKHKLLKILLSPLPPFTLLFWKFPWLPHLPHIHEQPSSYCALKMCSLFVWRKEYSFLVCFSDRVLLFSPGWLWTHNLPISGSWMLTCKHVLKLPGCNSLAFY